MYEDRWKRLLQEWGVGLVKFRGLISSNLKGNEEKIGTEGKMVYKPAAAPGRGSRSQI